MAALSGLVSALESYRGRDRLEEDAIIRWLSVVSNLADQLYYPCEHVAWAADAKIIHINSTRWWILSTALWGLSLLLGIGRSLKIMLNLRRKLRNPEGKSSKSFRREKKMIETQVKSEILSLLSNLADLANAIHWLPPGFLWAGQFPPWLVGLMGTVSSLISVYQASGSHSEKPDDS
ncbi:peroxisomal membrane protein 11C [Gracilinanus agilis]|uniref:peroxisomal membrane protein 11C n=1 Tax=Gracilinanus agilis TaxID=191870 RepID=UPI001CFD843C|nr:peroxisomal membrane protein 11C [Gracilinanus agilis]